LQEACDHAQPSRYTTLPCSSYITLLLCTSNSQLLLLLLLLQLWWAATDARAASA
jgi:hypothetical protein